MSRATITQELLREYAARKAKADAEAEQRHHEIALAVPLYGDMGGQLAAVMAACARTGEEPTQAVAQLRARCEAALAKAGYTPEDLAPRYTCPLCNDTGYVGEPVRSFCACFTKALQERVVQRSGLGSAPGHTFAHFDLSVFPDTAQEGRRSQRESMRLLLGYATKWAETFPACDSCNLLLSGPSGLGKTFLLDCIAAAVLERGFPVLRMTAFRLLEALRLYHMGRDDEGLLDIILQVDLLLIDDLGTEPLLENISIEYLFTVLNERQQAHRHTLVGTNLTLAELRARYTERITSRLLHQDCARFIRLEGDDLRLRRE